MTANWAKMEEEIVRTRREVTETTEEDEDCQVFDAAAELPREADSSADSEERGRQLNRKTVTTTVRVGSNVRFIQGWAGGRAPGLG